MSRLNMQTALRLVGVSFILEGLCYVLILLVSLPTSPGFRLGITVLALPLGIGVLARPAVWRIPTLAYVVWKLGEYMRSLLFLSWYATGAFRYSNRFGPFAVNMNAQTMLVLLGLLAVLKLAQLTVTILSMRNTKGSDESR